MAKELLLVWKDNERPWCTIAQDCVVTISGEAGEKCGAVLPKNPTRTLRKGDKVKLVGSTSQGYELQVRDESGERFWVNPRYMGKILVE